MMVEIAENLSFAVSPRAMTQEQFLTQFGGIYEHSGWVALAVLAAGLGPADDQIRHLGNRMVAIVNAANDKKKLALLCAHPELAGKLAINGRLTADSTAEQAGAGLDKCSPEEFTAFNALNAAYGEKFGHPFIIAVRGLTRSDILATFRHRIDNDKRTEFAAALKEVHKIACIRLERLSGCPTG